MKAAEHSLISKIVAQFTQQPPTVWAITIATMFSFMGIGLVSPILPTISATLHASTFETMLLFTSYLLVTALTMFFAGYISSRIGIKATLSIGLIIIAVFASLAGMSDTIGQIIGLRAGWGFGNGLFVTMALAGIVGSANGGSAAAIMLYEAALGLGMALGPLVGGVLGTLSWRAPFLGTAILMAIAATTVTALVKPIETQRTAAISVGFTALRERPLLLWSIGSLLFNFTVVGFLAYTPHALAASAEASGISYTSLTLGLVFFGWGVVLAIFSLVLPRIMKRALGLIPAIILLMLIMVAGLTVLALNVFNFAVVAVVTIIMGGFQGASGALLTEAALNATDLPRNIASSSFSALRFLGGAVFPLVSGATLAWLGAPGPYWSCMAALLLGVAMILLFNTVLPPHQRALGWAFTRRRTSVGSTAPRTAQ